VEDRGMEDLKSKLTSRKLAVVLASFAMIGAAMFSGVLEVAEGVENIVKVAMAYIGGQGLVDVAGAIGPVLAKMKSDDLK